MILRKQRTVLLAAIAVPVASLLTVVPDHSPLNAQIIIQPSVLCIKGLSKNLCQGQLIGGQWTQTQCTDPTGVPCLTVHGRKVNLRLNLQNNPEPCDTITPPTGLCDEVQDLNGPLTASLNFKIRGNDPCPYRGCWSGVWQLSHPQLPVIVARGNFQGTMGVGTHRLATCVGTDGSTQTCGVQCEQCYEVRYDPSSDRWKIHVEGVARGRIYYGPNKDCSICATLEGDFIAVGNQQGPFPPAGTTEPWQFCGTMDGVVECRCPTPFHSPNRLHADFDYDGDADVADFIEFQACYNGPENDPACED